MNSNRHRRHLIVLNFIAFVILAILLCLSSSLSHAQERDEESADEGRKRLEKIAEEIAEKIKEKSGHGIGTLGSTWWGICTAVPADALKESRGQTEDELRMYLLARFPVGETYDKIKDILNSPWDDHAVRDLWKLDAYAYDEDDIPQQRGIVLDLLVYAGTKYQSDVLIQVRSILDDLFQKFGKPELDATTRDNAVLLAFVRNALEEYGTLELLPESFWTAMEREDVGEDLLQVVAKLGDSETLKWLEDFRKTCAWQKEINLRFLRKTISELKTKTSNRGSENRREREDKSPQDTKHAKPEHSKRPPEAGNGSKERNREPETEEPTEAEVQKPKQTAQSTELPASGVRKESSSSSAWLVPLGVVLLAVAFVFVIALRARKRRA